MTEVVVHRGSPEAVISVVHHLQKAGIEARVLDQPNFVVLMISFGTYKSRVVVPERQAQAALDELQRWGEESREELAQMSNQLGRQVLWATLWSVVAGFVIYTGSEPGQEGINLTFALPMVWLFSFIAITVLAAVWRRD